MLFAVGLVLLLFCVAIAVDVGSVMVVKTQLQSAADASALAAASKLGLDRSVIVAEAKTYADSNKKVGGGGSELKDADVVIGVWHRAGEGQKGWFEPKPSGNAVKVTTRSTAQGTFFMPVFKARSFDSAADAIACAVPRDIVFVMDLSGSMDDDSDPAWATEAIEGTYGGAGQGMADELYGDLFPSGTGTEFNLMTYLQGRGHSVAGPEYAYSVLTSDDGPLVADGIINPGRYVPDPATYTPALREAFRTLTYIRGDNEITRRNKAYDWLLTKLHAPNPPLTAAYKNYWYSYLDYVLYPVNHQVPPPNGPPRKPSPPDLSPCLIPHTHPDPGDDDDDDDDDGGPGPGPGPGPGGPIGFLDKEQPWYLAWKNSNWSSPPRRQQGTERLALASSSAAQGAFIAGAVLGWHDIYDSACVAQKEQEYQEALAAWRVAMDAYYQSYLPAYLASKRPYGAAPWQRGELPPDQRRNEYNLYDRMADFGGSTSSYDFNNPNEDLGHGASPQAPVNFSNRVGHRTYAQFNLDHDRDLPVDGEYGGNKLVPLSLDSGLCPEHSEPVTDNEYGTEWWTFPPRVYPLHAARRSLIRALMVVAYRNNGVDPDLRDRVALIGFDKYDPDRGWAPRILGVASRQIMKTPKAGPPGYRP